jgi:hypothetical protein
LPTSSTRVIVDKLNQTNELIHQLLNDKRRMLGSLLHIDDANYDAITEVHLSIDDWFFHRFRVVGELLTLMD